MIFAGCGDKPKVIKELEGGSKRFMTPTYGGAHYAPIEVRESVQEYFRKNSLWTRETGF
jgi:hypothetical protein